MTCRRSPCTLSSRVIGRSSQSGSPATGWFTLGTIGQMALTVSGHKCQHYSGSGQTRLKGREGQTVSGRAEKIYVTVDCGNCDAIVKADVLATHEVNYFEYGMG